MYLLKWICSHIDKVYHRCHAILSHVSCHYIWAIGVPSMWYSNWADPVILKHHFLRPWCSLFFNIFYFNHIFLQEKGSLKVHFFHKFSNINLLILDILRTVVKLPVTLLDVHYLTYCANILRRDVFLQCFCDILTRD
jgi:hypothetical protein